MPGFHHIELWVADLKAVHTEWAWLLEQLGFTHEAAWSEGVTWNTDGSYLTITTSPNLSGTEHNRRRPGLNHLAFKGGDRTHVDAIMALAPAHGWKPLYHERYPHAGGSDHYAGWLENSDGFKVEVVAEEP
jgi:catechol 2,3-dioxygenase-like lactoylglutathione lyase family enzyme